MNINCSETEASSIRLYEKYEVVADDATHALRISLSNWTDERQNVTTLVCSRMFQGEDLTFTDGLLSDNSNMYVPKDPQGRKLELEISPPLTEKEEREHAVRVFAGAILQLSSSPGDAVAALMELPGNLRIMLY